MFEQETPLTKRINELAKKAKTVGLTEAEKEEQTLLRQELNSARISRHSWITLKLWTRTKKKKNKSEGSAVSEG